VLKWEKRGLVFRPAGRSEWMRTHAAAPLVHSFDDRSQRIYYASRDADNRSHIGWVDMDLREVGEPFAIARNPALAPGALGCFDDHGVYPGSIVEHGGRLLLYYAGWNPGPRQPLFTASIGLAISDDGGVTFERWSPAPILSRGRHDPCLLTSPCVLHEGAEWRMWYVGGFRWTEEAGVLQSYYDVKYARSDDGLHWERDGRVAIPLRAGERNIGRPCVVALADGYEMWYSTSGEAGYRAGYAQSSDGLEWSRLDEEAGLAPSPEGWDSRAIAYPWVTLLDGARYAVYNGNDYGREGFGLAVAAA
jgi:predicted GH43/DUF377 family glycosyl hydrolase